MTLTRTRSPRAGACAGRRHSDGLQDLDLPSGTLKVGDTDFTVTLNSSPQVIAAIGDVPVKRVGERTIYVRDVANVRDGYGVQNDVVRRDDSRPARCSDSCRAATHRRRASSRSVEALLQQCRLPRRPGRASTRWTSPCSSRRRSNIMHEAIVAGVLTALMILLFLGSSRSTIVVATSISLSILVSVLALDACASA